MSLRDSYCKRRLHAPALMSFHILSRLVFCLVLFFIAMSAMCGEAADGQPGPKKHVLVLHSYHRGLTWTDNVHQGIRAILMPRDTEFDLHVEYMDTKRADDDEHFRNIFNLLSHKYSRTGFSAIICSDDDAYNFLLKFRDELFPGVPIVFCGVNYFSAESHAGREDFVTGVVESFDVRATLRAAFLLHPMTTRVVIINDRTTTGLANRKIIDPILGEYADRASFAYLDDLDMTGVEETVKTYSAGTVILLMTFNKDKSGNVFDYDESIARIANAARVPVYGVWDFYLGRGIVGGMLTSGRDQGATAAGMALRIMDGTPVRDIPVVTESPNRFMFDFRQMERFGIGYGVLPTGSLLINRPVSFYEEHREKVLSVLVVFAMLSALLIALLVNIRKRQRIEESLRMSEEKFSKTFRSSPDWISVTRLSDGTYIDVNDTYTKMTGYSRDEVIGKSVFELGIYARPEERDQAVEVLKREGRMVNQEMQFRMKSGEVLTVQRSAEVIEIGGEPCLVSIVRDITDRKKAELALLESEQRYRAIFENAPDAIFIINAEGEDLGRIVAANSTAAGMHGYADGELVGMLVKDIDAPCETGGSGDRIGRMLEGDWIKEEVMHCRKDGSLFPVETSAGIFTLSSRRYIVEFVRDISVRKEIEAALRESERRFREMLETMNLAAILLDRQGNIVFSNEYFLELAGWDRAGVTGSNFYEHFCLPAECEKAKRQFLDSIQKEEFILHNEGSLVTRNGEVRRISWNNTLLRDLNGRVVGAAGIGEDITERMRLEDQLRQAQKIEAVGQLAGGIAHDFNNILTATIGYCHLLLGKLPEGEVTRYYAQQILASSEKAAGLTQSLLAFSRKQILNPQPVDLNALVSRLRSLLSRLITEDIEITMNLFPGDLIIMADSGQIEQVIINLATNARDAMPEGGRLTTSLGCITIDEQFMQEYGFGSPGRYAVITMADTGEGMSEETRRRVFEPFFTTKDMGKGTGLGLSIVYGIVKQHEGFIDVSSAPGKGTIFGVYLPIAVSDVLENRENAEAEVAGGTETILVVEDNNEVRDIVSEVLTTYGYHVIEATNGDEALAVFEDQADRIDLVVLDVIMPQRSGKEVYDRLREIKPGIPAIFMSGYTADIITQRGVTREGLNFLQKPVSPAELLGKVRSVLDHS